MRPRTTCGYLIAGALVASAYPFLRDGNGVVYDAWYELFGLSAVAALLVGARLNRTTSPAAWLIVAAGQMSFAAGDAVFIVYQVRGLEVPFPSVADIFYLAGYPLIAAGLLVMIRRSSPGRDWPSLIDAAIVTTGAGVVSWVFLMEPYATDSGTRLADKFVSIAYPLGDVLILAVAARLMMSAGKRSPAFAFVVGAVFIQLGADIAYGIASLQGWYGDGSLIDVPYVAAYLAWGAAALLPSMRRLTEPASDPEQRLTRRRLALLAFASLMAPSMMAFESVRSSQLQLLVTVGAAVALFLLVTARLAAVVSRHERAVRRENLLQQAAGGLVAAHARDEMYRIAVTTAVALAERDDVRAELALEADGERAVAAAAGASAVAAGASVSAFPLVVQGEPRGEITVRGPRPLAPRAREGIQTLASQVALAIESATLTEELLERQSAERFRALVQHSSDVIAVLEPDLTIRYHTPSVSILGFGPTELVGLNLAPLLHEDDAQETLTFYADLRQRPGAHAQREIRLRRKDGSFCIAETVSRNLLEDPSVHGIVLTARDVTERRALEEQLTHQAFHDSLTNLANRALFSDRVTHALTRSRRRAEQIAVLFVDLDDFKTVNDSLGHAAGDELLGVTAQRLESCLRAGDTCARLGGDEFAVLLEDVNGEEAATLVAERVLTALSGPVRVAEREMLVRASIGVAVAAPEETASDLLRNADVAMYRAKTEGKGRFEIFQPDMHAEALARLALKGELQRAVGDWEFELHYQPLVELASGAIAGFEALLRWSHPSKGLIGPADFIPLAEETGLIIPIGLNVLRHACEEARRWQQALPGSTSPTVSVNISARQLQAADFVASVQEALEATQLAPSLLTLEITESVLMGDTDATIARLRELRALGVRIAIDDFGTGYSSLNYLHRLPVDVLKIAKPFVDGIVTSSEQMRLAAAIVRLGSALGLETVAEGIELPLQRDRLRELGCALGQGYYFSRPVPAEAVPALLQGEVAGAA